MQHYIYYLEIPILLALAYRTREPLVLFETALLNRYIFPVLYYLEERLETIIKHSYLVLS